VTTNIPYLLAILEEEQFQQGQTTTHYLAEKFPNWVDEAPLDEEIWLAIAAFEALQGRGETTKVVTTNESSDPWALIRDWRNV
jgi:acetyl/propionyl-CoA carboxylase alpha subunit